MKRRTLTRRIERHVLLLFVLFCLAFSSPVQAAERVYQIQATPASDGVHYVWGYEGYSTPPTIKVVNGTLGIVSIAGDHGAIAFRLNWCDSRFSLNGKVIVERRCMRFPYMAKR